MADYYGDGIGIRVSLDRRTCWAIVKRSQGRWSQDGDCHRVADLSAFDEQLGGLDSPLKVAWNALGNQNQEGRIDLQKFIE